METIALTPADVARFWAKVKKTEGCWEWQGSLNRGYGRVMGKRDANGGRKNGKAHRVAYELTVGPIPPGMFIDHRCHNRICVNPEHLRPATNKQNLENLSGPHADSTSGVLGVHWKKRDRRWSVAVGHNGKLHYGGYFTDIREAAEVARKMRLDLFTHNDADRRTP